MTDDETRAMREKFKDIYGDGREIIEHLGRLNDIAVRAMTPFIAALQSGDDALTEKVIQAYGDAAKSE